MPSHRQQGRQNRKENRAGELAGKSVGDRVPHAALQGPISLPDIPPAAFVDAWRGGGKGEKTTGLATVEVPLSLTTSKSRPRHLSASHPPHPQATFRNPPPLRRSLCLRKEKASVWSTIRKRRKNCSTRYTQAALQNRFLNRAGCKGGGRGGEGK